LSARRLDGGVELTVPGCTERLFRSGRLKR
jgi:hypothetical protein